MFLLYSSDHGESLGEFGRLTHGGGDFFKEQLRFPFMGLVSNSYKLENFKKWLAKKEALKNNNISHDYIFHSILDCLGIQSEIVDKSLSLWHSKTMNR